MLSSSSQIGLASLVHLNPDLTPSGGVVLELRSDAPWTNFVPSLTSVRRTPPTELREPRSHNGNAPPRSEEGQSDNLPTPVCSLVFPHLDTTVHDHQHRNEHIRGGPGLRCDCIHHPGYGSLDLVSSEFSLKLDSTW